MSEIKTEHGIFTDLKDRDGNVIKTAQEYYEWWLEQNKIDICLEEVKSNQDLTVENNQLWDIVKFLLKDSGFIPTESEVKQWSQKYMK